MCYSVKWWLVCVPVIAIVAGQGCLDGSLDQNDNPVDAPQKGEKSVVSVTISHDYSVGNVGVVSLDSSATWKNLLEIHSDNAIASYNGDIFILERGQKSNIIKCSGPDITANNVLQEHINDNANIHDIIFTSATKAYVTQYDLPDLATYNPATGLKANQTVDLSAFTATEGTLPNPDRGFYHGSLAWIALQRWNSDWTVTEPGLLVLVDPETDQVAHVVTLSIPNPQGMYIYEQTLFVAGTGMYTVMEGGVQTVNLATREVGPVLLSEADLARDVVDLLVISSTKGYAIVSGASYMTSLVTFDPSEGTWGQEVAAAPSPAALAFDGTYLYVASRDLNSPGVVVIDPRDNTRQGQVYDVGLPPNDLIVYEARN